MELRHLPQRHRRARQHPPRRPLRRLRTNRRLGAVWSSVVLLVEAGFGISLLPLNLQQDTATDLAFCPLTTPNATIELVMAWHPLREPPALITLRKLAQAAAHKL